MNIQADNENILWEYPLSQEDIEQCDQLAMEATRGTGDTGVFALDDSLDDVLAVYEHEEKAQEFEEMWGAVEKDLDEAAVRRPKRQKKLPAGLEGCLLGKLGNIAKI